MRLPMFYNPECKIQELLDVRVQAAFFNRYKNELSHQHRHMIGDFLESYQRGFLVLVRKMVQHKIFKIGLGKNLMYFYTLYLLRSRVVESFKQGRQG